MNGAAARVRTGNTKHGMFFHPRRRRDLRMKNTREKEASQLITSTYSHTGSEQPSPAKKKRPTDEAREDDERGPDCPCGE